MLKRERLLMVLVVAGLVLGGCAFNSRSDLPSPPLIQAIERGDLNTVRNMLDRGANPNETSRFDSPAIREAVLEQEPEMVRALLEAGADARRWRGERPLVILAAADFRGARKSLVRAEEESIRILELLMEVGLDPCERSTFPGDQGARALELAARNNRTKVVDYLRPIDAACPQ